MSHKPKDDQPRQEPRASIEVTRQKLRAAFLTTLAADFKEHGAAVIRREKAH